MSIIERVKGFFVKKRVNHVDAFKYAILVRDDNIRHESVTQEAMDAADRELERNRKFMDDLYQVVADDIEPMIYQGRQELEHWRSLESRVGKSGMGKLGASFVENIEGMTRAMQISGGELKRLKHDLDVGVTEEETTLLLGKGFKITQEELQSATQSMRDKFPELENAMHNLKSSYLVTLKDFLKKSEKARGEIERSARTKKSKR